MSTAESAPLRLAYIGAGGFTNAYMYPQLHCHSVALAAVCDLVEEKARFAARRYGFGAAYTDFRAMLDEVRPDCVICVGGPKVHYEVGSEVLERGFPLYIQKSPAPTTEMTRELAAIAARKGVVCHVGFNLRQSDAVRRSREVMSDGGFGPVSLAIVRYGLVSGATLRDAVLDQHCHAYDTIRQLGGEVAEMQVRAGTVPGVRSYAAVLRFESGAVGSLNFTAAQIPNKEFVYFEVTGSGGQFVTCHDFDLTVRRADGPDEVRRIGNFGGGALRELGWMGYIGDLAAFFAAVRGDAPDNSPIADAIPTMELCEEAYRQLQEQGAEP